MVLLKHWSRTMNLIPIRSLRSEGKCNQVSNLKYLQAMIGGNIYFVSLDERIPQGTTLVIRDKDPRSLIGIPKASDGFNMATYSLGESEVTSNADTQNRP
jgi:hypothetical protein